jgi:CheY-like chemotaxis protein
LIIEGDPASRKSLLDLLGTVGYEVSATASPDEGFAAVRNLGFDLLLLDANLSDLDCCQVLKEIKGSAATEAIRVILLSGGGAGERGRGLDLGADDVLSRPWQPAELLARVRAQLRTKHALDQLREKTRITEEAQEIAHSAFQALAVTEKMGRDAFSLGRMLKVGVAAFFMIAAVTVGILVVSSHRAEKETKRAYAVITQLERGMAKQQDLVAQSRKIREEIELSTTSATSEQKQQTERQFKDLGEKATVRDSAEMAALRQQLAETGTRLRRIERTAVRSRFC